MSGRTSKTRKILGSLVVLGVLGGLVGLGAFSAFTANTVNSGNSVSSGTVKIDQDNAGVMFSVTNMKPGAANSVSKCVDVTYTGSLGSDVYLYGTNVATNGTKYMVTVDRGTNSSAPGAGHSCAGFTSSSNAFAQANLSTFPTSYATGVAGKAAAASWATNDKVGYRFNIERVDDPTVNAHVSATEASDANLTFTWEARNN